MDEDTFETLSRVANGDLRKAITTLQSAVRLRGPAVAPATVLDVAGAVPKVRGSASHRPLCCAVAASPGLVKIAVASPSSGRDTSVACMWWSNATTCWTWHHSSGSLLTVIDMSSCFSHTLVMLRLQPLQETVQKLLDAARSGGFQAVQQAVDALIAEGWLVRTSCPPCSWRWKLAAGSPGA